MASGSEKFLVSGVNVCGEKCEVYSRITGYLRPVQRWNDGKKSEYADRKLYKV